MLALRPQLLLLFLFITFEHDARAVDRGTATMETATSVLWTIDIELYNYSDSQTSKHTFALHQGDHIGSSVEAFIARHELRLEHQAQLFNAVREAILVDDDGPFVAIPTQILLDSDVSPFTHLPGAADVRTVVIMPSVTEGQPQQRNPAYEYYSDLTELLRTDMQSGLNIFYALIAPSTRFQAAIGPAEMIREYQRLSFAHAGDFQTELTLVLSCPRSTPEEWSQVMFFINAVKKVDLEHSSTEEVVEALQKGGWVYRPQRLEAKWLKCARPLLPPVPEELDALIVVIAEGPEDSLTKGVFEEVAMVVNEGLHELGLSSAIAVCGVFTDCRLPLEGPQWIVLAPHNLASYVVEDGTPAVLVRDDWLPTSAVLYNFETVPPPKSSNQAGSSLVSSDVLDIYRSYTLWEYSRANLVRLAAHNLSATYMNVGYSRSLSMPHMMGRQEPQIEVLFYGTVLRRRQKIVADLRRAGMRVMYPTSAGRGTFGADLDELIGDAKIVLSLLAFDDDAEWKMTRFMKPLANKRLIIAEQGRVPAEEQALFHGGVVFVHTSDIVNTCRYYLDHPKDRFKVAEEGYRLYRSMAESAFLSAAPQIQALMERKRRVTDADVCGG